MKAFHRLLYKIDDGSREIGGSSKYFTLRITPKGNTNLLKPIEKGRTLVIPI